MKGLYMIEFSDAELMVIRAALLSQAHESSSRAFRCKMENNEVDYEILKKAEVRYQELFNRIKKEMHRPSD